MFKKHKYTVRIGPNLSRDNICVTLRDLVPFVQFKKREKHSELLLDPYQLFMKVPDVCSEVSNTFISIFTCVSMWN